MCKHSGYTSNIKTKAVKQSAHPAEKVSTVASENILIQSADCVSSAKTKILNKSSQYSSKIELDKFYTKPSVAIDCITLLNMDEYDFVIEPSAGNGSFFLNIPHPFKMGLDLKPECSLVETHDWLTYKVDQKYKNVLILGNPPFGRRNKLSISFNKHALTFDSVRTIAFILPDVFHKHTLQKYFPPEFRLKTLMKLPPYSFEVDGAPYNVPCTFFIFDKSPGQDLKFMPEKYKDTKDFIYGSKNNYDFFVMGAAPYNIKDSPSPTNRGYYIKVREGVAPEQVRCNFESASWVGNSSVAGGVSWFTQPEMVRQYRQQFEDKT